MGEKLKKLQDTFTGDKKIKIIVLIGILGIAFIFLSQFFPSTGDGTKEDVIAYTATQYEQIMEEKLEAILKTMDGVGKATVKVTLESGQQTVYVVNQKRTLNKTDDQNGKTTANQDVTNEVVLINGQKEALIERVDEPLVKGVVVVCEGGDNIIVQENVINAAKTIFHIGSNRVFVTK